MFGLDAKVSSLALCAFFSASFAVAEPGINPGEMKKAVELANSSFKGCITQSKLYQDGVSKMSRSDLSAAKKLSRSAEQAFVAQFNPAAVSQGNARTGLGRLNLGGLVGANQVNNQAVAAQQALAFSLGSGYASRIQSWLQPYNAGDPHRAAAMLAHERPTKIIQQRKYRSDPSQLADEAVAKRVGVLGLVERGMVSLSGGDLECTVDFFDHGIREAERRENSIWGGELQPYEHIMAINMKAVGYLLAGDERARNMAQASRELQGRARSEYADEIAAKKMEVEQKTATNNLPNQLAWIEQMSNAISASAIGSNATIANRMTSPYVNPLADYLSAVVAETEASAGTGTRDEWSRASIAWKNASQLAPSSPFLKSASQETNRWQRSSLPGGKKIVNVMIASGAAPTDVVSKMYFNYQNDLFPVMMPVKVAHDGAFSGGAITSGGESSSFEIVSDIEGMVMRDAQDRQSGEILSAILRGWIAFEAAKAVKGDGGMLGTIASTALRDGLAEPTTDSWSSLPAAYYASRIVVPVEQTDVTVSVNGVGSQTFQLNDDQATFVYANVKNGRIWGKSQRAAFGGDRLEFEVQ